MHTYIFLSLFSKPKKRAFFISLYLPPKKNYTFHSSRVVCQPQMTTTRLCRSGSLSNVVVRPRGRQNCGEEEDDGNNAASGGGGPDVEKRKKRTLDNGLELEEKKSPFGIIEDEAVLCDALDDDEASVSASTSAAEAMMRREKEDEPNEKPLKRVASKKAMRRMMDKGWSDEEEEEEEGGKGGRKKTPPGSPSTRRPSKLAAIARARGGLRKTATIHSHASVLDLIQMETREKEEEDRAGKLLGRLHISSEAKTEREDTAADDDDHKDRKGNIHAIKEDDSNLVSAAGLSKDYKEAEYDDSLREVIVSPSSSFPKDFTVLRELGKGLCGTVYLARLHDTKQLLAFKVMRKSKLVSVGEEKHAAYERHVHMDVSNGPFIATLFHSYDDPTAYYLLTEYAPCGDLFQCLVYHGLPSLSDAKVYISQVSAAIAYLHMKKYVYRDLKPENILLRANGDACLADFGMAKKIERDDERAYSFCGTSQYMSPEVMSKKGCRFEADLWSLGVLIYELCSGATPYANVRGNHVELYEAVMSVDMNGGVWCPHWFDADTVDIVRKLLRLDELARLGAGGGDAMDAYFSHPWFHNGEFKCDLKNVLRGEVTPTLKPRKRNIVYDLRLQNQLELGNVPWLIDDARVDV